MRFGAIVSDRVGTPVFIVSAAFLAGVADLVLLAARAGAGRPGAWACVQDQPGLVPQRIPAAEVPGGGDGSGAYSHRRAGGDHVQPSEPV